MEITKDELGILLHTLGLTDKFQKESYRNYFVSPAGRHTQLKIDKLVSYGLMKQVSFCRIDVMVFVVTEDGKKYVAAHREKPTLGQRRYHNYLELIDVFPCLTFKEFLTHPDFIEDRK